MLLEQAACSCFLGEYIHQLDYELAHDMADTKVSSSQCRLALPITMWTGLELMAVVSVKSFLQVW